MATEALWFTTNHVDRVASAPAVARREPTEHAPTEMLGAWLLIGTIAATTLAMVAAILWIGPGVAAGAAIASALSR